MITVPLSVFFAFFAPLRETFSFSLPPNSLTERRRWAAVVDQPGE